MKTLNKEVKETRLQDIICMCKDCDLIVIDHIEGEDIRTCGRCRKKIYEN